VEDLIIFNSDLYGKLDKLKQPNAISKCKVLVMKHKIVIPLLEDADGTVVQPPNPTNKDKKTAALLSFGIDVNKNPNILMLTAAYGELGFSLIDRESKQ
jgi:hypothetical protein